MSVSRRRFVGNGLAIGLLSSLFPPEAAEALAQQASAAPNAGQDTAEHPTTPSISGAAFTTK